MFGDTECLARKQNVSLIDSFQDVEGKEFMAVMLQNRSRSQSQSNSPVKLRLRLEKKLLFSFSTDSGK